MLFLVMGINFRQGIVIVKISGTCVLNSIGTANGRPLLFGIQSQGRIQDFSQGWAPSDELVLECC